jgi:DNA repair exonuclease SbcCD ATPase subunit
VVSVQGGFDYASIILDQGKGGMEMTFLKRLFQRQKKITEPMHGIGHVQTEAEQDITRQRMEADMASQRERRDESTRTEPNNNPPGAAP